MSEHDRPKLRGNQLMIGKLFDIAAATRAKQALTGLFEAQTPSEDRERRSAAQLKRERKQAKRVK